MTFGLKTLAFLWTVFGSYALLLVQPSWLAFSSPEHSLQAFFCQVGFLSLFPFVPMVRVHASITNTIS